MTEIGINPATVLLAAAVIILIALALRRLKYRGSCDCKDCMGDSGGCVGCKTADKMASDREKALCSTMNETKES